MNGSVPRLRCILNEDNKTARWSLMCRSVGTVDFTVLVLLSVRGLYSCVSNYGELRKSELLVCVNACNSISSSRREKADKCLPQYEHTRYSDSWVPRSKPTSRFLWITLGIRSLAYIISCDLSWILRYRTILSTSIPFDLGQFFVLFLRKGNKYILLWVYRGTF